MPSFDTIWKSFPDKSLIKARCQNKQATSSKPFGNYCAIMLSDALIKAGVSTANSKTKTCWSHSGMKHILLAEEMAHWLKRSQFSWLGKLEKITPATFQDDLDGRTGIIFFKDYWQRGNESFERRSGDHIDLWNKDEITSSSMFTRSILEFLGRVSDFNESREIWFWEVK
ncbi:type VI secretion system amidase effector protein Tae4 [Agarivorans sp. QJM3NY_29]|uniref:type VI secretion system amidase effector protein Tae4 n=1 Tax=unclassified Agarivorans TaxID=2636026 RepID=UPI003D7D6F60